MLIDKKNILYIGPYRQADGWGYAAYDYLLSLLTTEHNIASVPIYLNPSASHKNICDQVLAAENRSMDYYDVIIQKTLPQTMVYNSHAKNIGMLFLENNKLVGDSIDNLNLMDQLLVTSEKEKRAISNSLVSTPTFAVSHPLPTDDILNAQKHGLSFGSEIDKEYKFYFIGEYIQRKNIKDIVAAFHLEFDITEPVRLIIKTSIPGMNPSAAEHKIKSDIETLKKRLRVRNSFKEDIILTDKMKQEHLFALHNACDCFVSTSYGEAFCRPAAEALCFGKHIILAANIGAVEFADTEDCSIIDCQEQPVIVDDPSSFAGLDMYNAHETWCVPSILNLQKHMRQCYENRPTADKNKYLQKFSYSNIGKILCQHI
jgi:glycosyltransferase involved in cell wall biosynthesis